MCSSHLFGLSHVVYLLHKEEKVIYAAELGWEDLTEGMETRLRHPKVFEARLRTLMWELDLLSLEEIIWGTCRLRRLPWGSLKVSEQEWRIILVS